MDKEELLNLKYRQIGDLFVEKTGPEEGLTKIYKDGKWGYLKSNGSYFLLSEDIEDINAFSNGIAEVRKGNKYGYIKRDGTFLIEPIFDYEENYHELCWDVFFAECYDHGFINGKALVCLNGKYGYLKTDGSYLIEPIFDDAYSFRQQTPRIQINGKFGYLNEDGSYMFEPIFDNASFFKVDKIAVVFINSKYGLIKPSGEFLIKPIFEDIIVGARNVFSQKYIKVKINGKWAFLKSDGKYLFKPCIDEFVDESYEELAGLNYFENGCEKVIIDGCCGYINEQGMFSTEKIKR